MRSLLGEDGGGTRRPEREETVEIRSGSVKSGTVCSEEGYSETQSEKFRSGSRGFRGQGGDWWRAILLLAGMLLVLGNLVFSGPNSRESAREAEQTKEGLYLSDCLRIAGSSSMERYVSALAEGFMDNYPEVEVTIQFTGSSAGIAAVIGGTADIGLSSRDLTEEERAQGAVENPAGLDGIAVCANPANGVEGLTGKQLAEIYTGGIYHWRELGGNDVPVVVIGREAGSGTRDAFEKFLKADGSCVYTNELDSTGAVLARILSTPGAVGYASLEAADRVRNRAWEKEQSELTILSLDGAEPSLENITDGTYPLNRPLFMVTKGETALLSPLVQQWFAYIYGEEGRAVRERLGIAGQ